MPGQSLHSAPAFVLPEISCVLPEARCVLQLPRAAEGVSQGGPAPEDSFLLDDNRYIADVLYDFRRAHRTKLTRLQICCMNTGELLRQHMS